MCCAEYGEETESKYLATDFSWPLDYWLLTVELIFIDDQQIKFTARSRLLKKLFLSKTFHRFARYEREAARCCIMFCSVPLFRTQRHDFS